MKNSKNTTLASKKRLDYKWVIIAACFLMVFTCLGFCSSTKSFFIGPITENLGVDRSVYSINDSLRFISSAIINLFFGALAAPLMNLCYDLLGSYRFGLFLSGGIMILIIIALQIIISAANKTKKQIIEEEEDEEFGI
jgi:ABC-type Fe3+ transport system permease subunit